MEIRHKGIYEDRFEDAPFCGTLICAISCPYGCPNCINDNIKTLPYDTINVTELMSKITSNKFNEGIILAGLEWSEQPEELMVLVSKALKENLKVIIYTGLPNKESLLKKIPSLICVEGKGVLVKYGRYDETKLSHDYWSYGVRLASTNQFISEL